MSTLSPWRVARPHVHHESDHVSSSGFQCRGQHAKHYKQRVLAASSTAAWQAAQVSVRMAGTAGRSTSDSPDSQQLYEAADAAKEAAEADNLLDPLEIERSVTSPLHNGMSVRAADLRTASARTCPQGLPEGLSSPQFSLSFLLKSCLFVG